jgi:enoyl-CoA hydratase
MVLPITRKTLHSEKSGGAGMTVRVEASGAVRVVTIDRPSVHNCVDSPTAAALFDAVTSFDGDDEARVLVLTGAGGKSFCSGADLKSPPRLRESGPMGISRMDVGKPTIAAIAGYCYAGGLGLACWCDFRIADETSTFGVLNRRWGVPLIDGGTQRLPRIVGLGNALYLIETGARIDAATARRMGLVQEVVPAGRALDRCLELASRIADYPQASLRADRRSAIDLDGMEAEAERGEAMIGDPDMAEGLRRFTSGDRPAPPSG